MDIDVAALPKLTGQRVLITGAAGLLGSACARLFATCGAEVYAHARSFAKAQAVADTINAAFAAQPLVTSLPPGKVYPVAQELAAFDFATQLLAQIPEPLTGVLNCAATQPVAEFSAQDFTATGDMFAVNTVAAQELTRVAAVRLQPGGWITHIASIEGLRPAKGHGHYAASKAALIMLARAAALELGSQQLRVNVVSPGLIARPHLAKEWPAGVASWLKNAPLGRLVDPLDVANACVFLASPAAGAITGQNLVVDCGMQATPGW